MACIDCGAGFHFACKENPCCCSNAPAPVAEEINGEDNGLQREELVTYKRDSALKDQQSTGRKRAARLYPLDREAPCEWQGLLFAGGGQYPIVGCPAGLQQARHHGPDKNTLNNEEGNVHRICHRCHNRWHTKNDPGYEWGNPGKPHDAITKASVAELLDSEVYWKRNVTIKAKD